MVFSHFSNEDLEDIRLNEEQVLKIAEKCANCHSAEHAKWLSGGHAATYADIFLNKKHNSQVIPYDDCLRCHGMFFDGPIREIVQPLATTGSWSLIDPAKANQSTIPCLACHQVHKQGTPAMRVDSSDPKLIAAKRPEMIGHAEYYVRAEKSWFPIERLPEVEVQKNRQPIVASPDLRQRLCFQCHAPNTERIAHTSDDRTPTGVHAGISCLACHDAHSSDARQSCANCHPAMSNCGLDVETMDTSFKDPESKNNIHFVACSDCHTQAFLVRRGR